MSIASATAPGVVNALGRGQDPAPFKLPDGRYAFPDIDFGANVRNLKSYKRLNLNRAWSTQVFLRVSSDLSKVQSDDANKVTVFTYPESIGT